MKLNTSSAISAAPALLTSLELDTLGSITGGCAACGCGQPAMNGAASAQPTDSAKPAGGNLMQLITAGLNAFGAK
jgi:hypothetical protein